MAAPVIEHAPASKRRRPTSIETVGILFLLALLGFMAMATPQYSEQGAASERGADARRASMISMLERMREQIDIYKAWHMGNPPPATRMWIQLLNPTNATGQVASGPPTRDYPLGPYLNGALPNVYNGQTAVGTTPSSTIGWVYHVSGTTYALQAVNTAGDGVLTY